MSKKKKISKEVLKQISAWDLMQIRSKAGGKARAEQLPADVLSKIARMGAEARAEKLSAKKRSAIAKAAAQARWGAQK